MSSILAILFLAVAIAALVFALIALCWVGSGSPDCNGDPERDSGMSDDDLSRLARSWDHGSHETESRPNLDYARRLNREGMRSSAHH